MAESVQLLLLGFLLTSVVGGSLGYGFQRRTWKHQHEVQRREEEHRQALKTFEEISSLLDRRLHRSRRMYQALKTRNPNDADTESLMAARTDYILALDSWNENLNRMLALTQTYFGMELRGYLEKIQREYAAIGRAIDIFLQHWASGDERLPKPRLGVRLNLLAENVYQINLAMLDVLKARSFTDKAQVAVPEGNFRFDARTELGCMGNDVTALQKKLASSDQGAGLPVDGVFGIETYRALCRFQEANHLQPDGMPGLKTVECLENLKATPGTLTPADLKV